MYENDWVAGLGGWRFWINIVISVIIVSTVNIVISVIILSIINIVISIGVGGN